MKSAATLVLLLAVGAPLAPASLGVQPAAKAEAAGPNMPDTPQGRCAAAYFRAFNSGEEKAARDFESSYRAVSALAQTPLEERVKRYSQLRNDWGKLTVKQDAIPSDHSLMVLVACAGTGEDQLFEFQFDEAEKLKVIEIRGPIGADEAAALLSPLDAATRTEVVESLSGALEEMYVFPDTAVKLGAMLHERLASGKYDGITRAADFARVLTDDLQGVCHDKHLRVRPGSAGAGVFPGHAPSGPEREDYGFRKVERLPGNIGYIKFDRFHPAPEAKEIAGGALAFLSDCDALIFDVRDNGGGSPVMIQFLCSYLFESPTLLNTFYSRLGDQTSETWTEAEVPGKRFAADLPVYVLTSSRTFSAAEEFTYDLKCLKRATIVGQTTGGGAHPVRPRALGDRFYVTVPFARAINPITKTNWEGTGVAPDIEAPADQALDAAVNDAKARVRERTASNR